jgi:hypothetical protein
MRSSRSTPPRDQSGVGLQNRTLPNNFPGKLRILYIRLPGKPSETWSKSNFSQIGEIFACSRFPSVSINFLYNVYVVFPGNCWVGLDFVTRHRAGPGALYSGFISYSSSLVVVLNLVPMVRYSCRFSTRVSYGSPLYENKRHRMVI